MAFTVGANTGGARTGSLTIAGRAFTVTQAALCAYTLSKAGEKARCERGLCGRERLDDERLRVDGHQQQLVADHPVRIQRTGNGQVTYYIRENPGGARIGSLTVAGHLFGVEQDGR